MAFIKRLNENITTKRKTSTDIQPTGLLGNNLVTTAMLQDFSVTPSKLAFSTALNTNYGIACSVAANAATFSIVTAAGLTPSPSDPLRFTFRSQTQTLGTHDQLSVTGAVTLTVPAGATLGMANGVIQNVDVFAINNAGTVQLAVQGSNFLNTGGIQATTAISAGANSGTVFYSATSLPGGVPVLWLGRFRFTQATAGQWATPPSTCVANADDRGEQKDYVAAVSAVKTPTASANYHALTTNSVVLTPGLWDLTALALFTDNGTTAGYNYCAINTFDTNGLDSGVAPTTLGGLGTMIISGANQSGLAFAGGTLSSNPVRLRINQTSTIYVVTYAQMTTPANARITAYLQATRFR